MTHNEKLDSILNAYLHGQKLKLSNDPTYRKLTFALVVHALAPATEDWELEFLRNRLITDGYLKYNDFGQVEPMELTPAGIKFRQTSGYLKSQANNQLDTEIKVRTLKSLRQSKAALWTSIISMVGTVAAAFISFQVYTISKQRPATEEVIKSQQRIDTMLLELHRQQLILDSILVFKNDTLNHRKSQHP